MVAGSICQRLLVFLKGALGGSDGRSGASMAHCIIKFLTLQGSVVEENAFMVVPF